MSLAAPFVDGELVTNTSQIAKKETKTSASANSSAVKNCSQSPSL